MKNFFKKTTDPLVIVLIILVVVIIATWFPHNTYYENNSSSQINELIPVSGKYGLLDSTYAIWYGYNQMFATFLYIIVAGVIFSIFVNNGAIQRVISDIISGTNGNKYIFGSLIFSFIFLLSSIIGFFEQFIILLPLLWFSFDRVGVDKKVTTIILIMSTTMGRAFSTLSPYAYQAGFDSISPWFSEGNQINQMMGLRFLIMEMGMIFSLITLNVTLFISSRDNLLINNSEEDSDFDEFKRESSRLSAYLAWTIFFLMTIVIIIGSLDWEYYFGDDWNKFNEWWTTNLWFISSVFRSIGEWAIVEKVIVMTVFLVIMIFVFKITNDYKFNFNVVIETTTKMLKVYSVFAISKSISLILIYSGLADSIASGITWKADEALFLISMIPILFAITFFMNSQTSAFIIFTPIVAGIISSSGFDNPELILSLYMAMLSMIVGVNSMITPTQAMNSIPIKSAEIPLREYYSITIPISIVTIVTFGIVILPILTLI